MKSKQTDSTSSLKNGNLSLATFKGLRAQKFAKPKSRDLISDITDIVAYLCLSKYVIGFCSVLENNMEQHSVTIENFKQRKKCMQTWHINVT